MKVARRLQRFGCLPTDTAFHQKSVRGIRVRIQWACSVMAGPTCSRCRLLPRRRRPSRPPAKLTRGLWNPLQSFLLLDLSIRPGPRAGFTNVSRPRPRRHPRFARMRRQGRCRRLRATAAPAWAAARAARQTSGGPSFPGALPQRNLGERCGGFSTLLRRARSKRKLTLEEMEAPKGLKCAWASGCRITFAWGTPRNCGCQQRSWTKLSAKRWHAMAGVARRPILATGPLRTSSSSNF
mmetsp:Transcript_17600/g.48291  ORF Transcript_17600/g.48291 Transcript_17600/m.48291 type:complete len:238 (-) Transcript_17600:308-1021(-)